MLFNIPMAVDVPGLSLAAVTRFAELVKKIETSPSPSYRKRKNTARKKLKCVINEQQRHAKAAKLRAVAVTLTYSSNKDFSAKHISSFLDRVRRALRRLGNRLPYAWVLECAGRLHYHLILWLPYDYKITSSNLARWWPWGSTWIKTCKNVTAWGSYMRKADSITELPKGSRMYGYGGIDEAAATAACRSTLPRWLLALLPASHRARRRIGGGWVNLTTGEIYLSPYIWTPWGAALRVGKMTLKNSTM